MPDYLEQILGVFPWSLHGIWVKHPKNLATIVSNSSIGASKLIHEYDQVTGTPESSVVLIPLPIQPCDDAKDEGAVEVYIKLFKVPHHSLIYTSCQDPGALALMLTPSQSLLQSHLQLLSELLPGHEPCFLEAKPEVKPTCTITSQAPSMITSPIFKNKVMSSKPKHIVKHCSSMRYAWLIMKHLCKRKR